MNRFFIKLASIAALVLLHACAQAAETPTLMLTYHVNPASRVAFRKELETGTLPQWQRWQEQHLLKSYRLLFGRYADSDNWDAMAVLNFADAAEFGRWKAVEQQHPGGLSPKAQAMTTAVHTAMVEMARADASAEPSGHGVFVVIPYAVQVSPAEYLSYADGYVIPQFQGWIQENNVSHYGVYLNELPAGRPWSTMILLEYRDDAALLERGAIVDKVRRRLAENPEWKAISDNKKKIRDEKQVVVADPLTLSSR